MFQSRVRHAHQGFHDLSQGHEEEDTIYEQEVIPAHQFSIFIVVFFCHS